MSALWILAQEAGLLGQIFELFRDHWKNFAMAFGAILLAFVLRKFVAEMLVARLGIYSKGTKTQFDDLLLEAIKKPLAQATVLFGIWLAVVALQVKFGDPPIAPVSDRVLRFLTQGITILWIVLLGWVGLNLCDVVGELITRLTSKTETKLDDMLVPLVRRSMKLFVGLIAFILVVQNMGYSIGALLAGFSIGGVAIALASQDTLQNFFGSVVIFVDRPFQVGDWITVGGLEGVVEEVGFRSTRIRTFAQTLITVPNSKIAHEPVNNYSRMEKRRIKLNIGVEYTTSPDRLVAAVNAFRKILADDERVDQSFWLVNFREFGDSALVIFCYFYTKTTIWSEYLQVQQEINIKMMRALETLGVSMAFPSQTLYMRQDAFPEPPPLEEVIRLVCPTGDDLPTPEHEADDDADG